MSYCTDDRGYIYSNDVEVGMYRFRVAYDADTYDPVVTGGWVVQRSPLNAGDRQEDGSFNLVPLEPSDAAKAWDKEVASQEYFKFEVARMRQEFMQQVGETDEAGDSIG